MLIGTDALFGDGPVGEEGRIYFTWAEGIMLGAIISATDPVAVMKALGALNAPVRLGALIGGESLVNDGSAMVVFFVFYQHQNASEAIILFLRLVFGAVAMAIAGLIFLQFTVTRTRDSTIELMLLLGVVIGMYFIC